MYMHVYISSKYMFKCFTAFIIKQKINKILTSKCYFVTLFNKLGVFVFYLLHYTFPLFLTGNFLVTYKDRYITSYTNRSLFQVISLVVGSMTEFHMMDHL